MPTPSTTLTTLRPDLASSLEEFDLEMNRQNYIGTRVAPVIDVDVQAGKFGVLPLEALLVQSKTERAPHAGYARGDYEFEDRAFATKEHGAEEPVDAREAAMFGNYFDAELLAVRRAQQRVLDAHERRVASMLFNATTYTGPALTTAITHEWDDAANAVPVADVEAAVRKVVDGSGQWPNALIISRTVFRNLRNSKDILDRIKFQPFMDARAADIGPAELARVFDLDMVIVAGGLTKGSGGKRASEIWSGEYAMVAKIATTSDVREPCVARTFHWTGDGSQVGGLVEQYPEEATRSEIYRVRHETTEMLVYKECAHLLSNVTT